MDYSILERKLEIIREMSEEPIIKNAIYNIRSLTEEKDEIFEFMKGVKRAMTFLIAPDPGQLYNKQVKELCDIVNKVAETDFVDPSKLSNDAIVEFFVNKQSDLGISTIVTIGFVGILHLLPFPISYIGAAVSERIVVRKLGNKLYMDDPIEYNNLSIGVVAIDNMIDIYTGRSHYT